MSSVPGQGRAIRRSDVTGLPDTALSSGTVVLIAEARATGLAAAAGLDLTDPDEVRHASFPLDAAQAAEFGAVRADIDPHGGFRFEVPAGRYLVCLADVYADHAPGPPFTVVGCGLVTVPGSYPRTLTVSLGEAGVEASAAP